MIAIERLALLALGDADDAETAAIEEHVLACTTCATTLERLLRIGSSVRTLTRNGAFSVPVTASLSQQLRAEGLVSREYRLAPEAIVPCMVSVTDVYAMTTLEADLAGVTRASLVVTFPAGLGRIEMADIPFDAAAGTVSYVTSSLGIRRFPSMRITLELYADNPGDRLLGRYYLDHTAFAGP